MYRVLEATVAYATLICTFYYYYYYYYIIIVNSMKQVRAVVPPQCHDCDKLCVNIRSLFEVGQTDIHQLLSLKTTSHAAFLCIQQTATFLANCTSLLPAYHTADNKHDNNKTITTWWTVSGTLSCPLRSIHVGKCISLSCKTHRERSEHTILCQLSTSNATIYLPHWSSNHRTYRLVG